MFFLGRFKNKYFKKRANLSGQVMPFLLVIIAIFLGAFIATAKIGTVAINMTCSDNAADACALAAASHMAYLMNSIDKDAATSYENFFGKDNFQATIKASAEIVKEKLADAKEKIGEGLEAFNSAVKDAGPHGYCDVWYENAGASVNLDTAASRFEEAAISLSFAAEQMEIIRESVESYKEKTHEDYCESLTQINRRYNTAKTDGIKYALQNNCVYPNLSSSQQGKILNKVNNQAKTDEREQNYWERNVGAIMPIRQDRELKYDWGDSKGNYSMGAEVVLPKIGYYELEVTERNEPCPIPGETNPYGDTLSTISASVLQSIAFDLRDLSNEEEDIYVDSRSAKYCYKSLIGWICCGWKYWGLNNRANEVVNELNGGQGDIKTPLDNVVKAVDDLIKQYEKIEEDLGPGSGGPRLVSSGGCQDAEDVIIIGVHDVKFESGCISCEADMSNAGGSSSGKSISSFGGGSLDPAIPSEHYTPKILSTDKGCPGDGGLNIGTTPVKFDHEVKNPCPD